MARKIYWAYIVAIMMLLILELNGAIVLEQIMMGVLGVVLVIVMLTHAPHVMRPFMPFQETHQKTDTPFEDVLITIKRFLLIILPLIIYIILIRLI